MNKSADILLINDLVLIHQSFIIQHLDYSADYLRRCRNRVNKDLKSWKHRKIHGSYYYDYDHIPNNHRLGKKEDLLLQAKHVEDDRMIEARHWFEQEVDLYTPWDHDDYYMYKVPLGYRYNQQEARELCVAHGVIVTIRTWLKENKQREFNLSKVEVWECFLSVANKLCPKFLKLGNVTSLRNMIARLPKEKEALRDAMISKRRNNNCARKVGREENQVINKDTGEVYDFDYHQLFMFGPWQNYNKQNKLTKKQCYEVYRESCLKKGIKPVSIRTVVDYINKNRHWLSLERDGEDVFNSKYAPYVPAKKLQFSGSLWCADYSGTKLLYRDPSNKKGRNTFYMIRVIDVASGMIVGWAVTGKKESECGPVTMEAMKRALKTTSNHGAIELITDNGMAFKGKEVRLRLSGLFKKHTFISLGNKQANPAEVFVRLLSDYSRVYNNWFMLGFNSHFKSIDAMCNEDYLDVDALPTKAEAYLQIEELVKMWNKSARPNGIIPKVYYKENKHPNLLAVDELGYRKAFGNHTELNFSEVRGVLMVKKGDRSYRFDSGNWEETLTIVRNNTTDKKMHVRVIWDTNKADIYSLKGDHLTSLDPVALTHKSIAEVTDATEKALGYHLSKKQTFKHEALERTESFKEATDHVQWEEHPQELPYKVSAKLHGEGKSNKQALEQNIIVSAGSKGKNKVETLEEWSADDPVFDPVRERINQM